MTGLKLTFWRGRFAVACQPIIMWVWGLLCLSHLVWSNGITTPI